mmetsp:Transcript_61441/g.123155  ORF Transcript_61441/g.123155 Transcript_61441/m.123155 type:complete len:259 (-) Transcript_61441:1247-2023(-)
MGGGSDSESVAAWWRGDTNRAGSASSWNTNPVLSLSQCGFSMSTISEISSVCRTKACQFSSRSHSSASVTPTPSRLNSPRSALQRLSDWNSKPLALFACCLERRRSRNCPLSFPLSSCCTTTAYPSKQCSTPATANTTVASERQQTWLCSCSEQAAGVCSAKLMESTLSNRDSNAVLTAPRSSTQPLLLLLLPAWLSAAAACCPNASRSSPVNHRPNMEERRLYKFTTASKFLVSMASTHAARSRFSRAKSGTLSLSV